METRPTQIPDVEGFKRIAAMELSRWFRNALGAQTLTQPYINLTDTPDDFPETLININNRSNYSHIKVTYLGLLNDLNQTWSKIKHSNGIECIVDALLKLNKKYSDSNLNREKDDPVTFAITHDIQYMLMLAISVGFITDNLKGKIIDFFTVEDNDRFVYGKSSTFIAPESIMPKEPPQPQLTEKELLAQNRELKIREISLLRENSFLKQKVADLEHQADSLRQADMIRTRNSMR